MNDGLIETIIGFVVGVMLGAIIACQIVAADYKEKAIAHGAAYYNATNGVFTWKEQR